MRKCATSLPGGGAARLTTQACGVSQAGQRVAASTSGSPWTRCGMANESQAQPPHHSVRAPMTGKPSGTEAKG